MSPGAAGPTTFTGARPTNAMTTWPSRVSCSAPEWLPMTTGSVDATMKRSAPARVFETLPARTPTTSPGSITSAGSSSSSHSA